MNRPDTLSSGPKDFFLLVIFAAAVLTAPLWLAPIGANYPDLLQKFAIYGIFAIGFKLCRSIASSLAINKAAAPSFNPLAFPAVTVPPSSNVNIFPAKLKP